MPPYRRQPTQPSITLQSQVASLSDRKTPFPTDTPIPTAPPSSFVTSAPHDPTSISSNPANLPHPIDAPSVYTIGPYIFYRASALGHCIRQLLFTRLGFSPPNPYPRDVQLAFERGHEFEERYITGSMDAGATIVNRQQLILLFIANILSSDGELHPTYIVGHLDGMVDRTPSLGSWAVLECKSLTKDLAYKFEREGISALSSIPAHRSQFSAYMHATGLPLILALQNSNTSSVALYNCLTPPLTLGALRARVLHIESLALQLEPLIPDNLSSMVDRKRLSRGLYTGLSHRFPACEPDPFFCPYSDFHPDKPPPEETYYQSPSPVLDSLVHRIQTLRHDIHLFQDEELPLKQQLTSILSKLTDLPTRTTDAGSTIREVLTGTIPQGPSSSQYLLRETSSHPSQLIRADLEAFLNQHGATYDDFCDHAITPTIRYDILSPDGKRLYISTSKDPV